MGNSTLLSLFIVPKLFGVLSRRTDKAELTVDSVDYGLLTRLLMLSEVQDGLCVSAVCPQQSGWWMQRRRP
jgi:hypothetical protein